MKTSLFSSASYGSPFFRLVKGGMIDITQFVYIQFMSLQCYRFFGKQLSLIKIFSWGYHQFCKSISHNSTNQFCENGQLDSGPISYTTKDDSYKWGCLRRGPDPTQLDFCADTFVDAKISQRGEPTDNLGFKIEIHADE